MEKLYIHSSLGDRGNQNKDLLSSNSMSEMCPVSSMDCQIEYD